MLKQRRLAAETVAEALFAAERAIDAAIASTATLAGLMPTTRQEANLSALVGQDALMSAINTMQALGVARENIVVTHKHLSVAQHDIGLAAISFGQAPEKPGDGATRTGRLSVAA
ncbi:hypothetical protein B7G68_18340 [Caulobacter segnis]|uniref:Uncharacterized protein n=2 Tax=Caulobacter segnis TaxID=88688 RepID=D5VND3_CAUST|nr:hypothetical protein [Caulobacter segnis]ADG12006.1 conserved hypothetical protein [Caulobacter segnis ATCC 21756]AVQ03625.1 hypothetical protein B7G68_18340 [Caulobacter segnis]